MIRSADCQPWTIGFRAAALLLVLFLGPALRQPAVAADSALSEGTAKYFRELRRRGLYRLAESYCLERLSRSGLSLAQRTELTLELSRSLAEHAALAVEPEQSELWTRARATLADFLKQEPNNPRRLMLEAQAAIVSATIGHTRRWQAELQPFDTTAAQRAAQSLNEAIEELRTLEAALADRLRKSPAARGAGDGELKGFEVRALGANVRYRLGSAQMDLAHLHPADSPERAALLLDAQKMLKSVPEAGDDSDLLWMSRVACVECSRLLGDPVRTLKELDVLARQSPPPEFADRLLAERVRTLMAYRKFSEAAALLDGEEQNRSPLPGELALLAIQLPIARWQAGNPAAGEPLPKQLEAALEERGERLRRDVGGYWSYRSDLLLQQVRDIGRYGPELAGVAGKAQSAFNAGRLEEAVHLYGDAAAKALRAGRSEQAFHFAFTRAAIEIKGRNWADAAADFLELSEQFPENPKTPEAHLLAAFALGKSYDEKPTPSRREEYTRVLSEHRTRYGNGPTAPEATWLLAKLQERRGKITAALELYKSIPPEHKRASATHVAIARTYEIILDRLRELHEPLGSWEEEAIQTLEQLLAPLPDRMDPGRTDPGNLAETEVRIRLARILLRATPPQFETADDSLKRAAGLLLADTSPSGEAPPAEIASQRLELLAMVRQLQVVSLAGRGKAEEAQEMLHKLSAASPAEFLRILDGIAPLQADDRQDPYHDLGKLQLEAALALDQHRSELSAAQQRRLDECLARAYVATGERNLGIAKYEELLKRFPRDTALLTAFTELLMKCGEKPEMQKQDRERCLRKALGGWQKLEAMHKDATPEWFALRYQVCRTLMLLEDKSEAAKLLKMTRLLYPKIEDESLQKKFAELEARCAKGKEEKSKMGRN